MIIAIDGPAASGKGTLGKLVNDPKIADDIRLAWPVSETFAFPAEAHA